MLMTNNLPYTLCLIV